VFGNDSVTAGVVYRYHQVYRHVWQINET